MNATFTPLPQPWELVTPKDAVDYNSALRREIISARCGGGKTADQWYPTYNFHFTTADENGIVNDFVQLSGQLKVASEIEQIWDEIAEAHSSYFERGAVIVSYPQSHLPAWLLVERGVDEF